MRPFSLRFFLRIAEVIARIPFISPLLYLMFSSGMYPKSQVRRDFGIGVFLTLACFLLNILSAISPQKQCVFLPSHSISKQTEIAF
jgi:hypothetical protein